MKLIARTVWLTDLLCCPCTYCTLLLTDFLSCREWMSRHTHEISIRALNLPYFSSLLLLEQFCTLREICATWYHANQGLCRMLMAPFSEQQHTFRHPAPKIAENFFGKPFGSPMTKNTLFLVFNLFWGALGAIFQKTLNFSFFKFSTFWTPYLGSHWT